MVPKDKFMITEQIAILVTEKKLKEYSPKAIQLAKDAILDYLAVSIAARNDPISEKIKSVFYATDTPNTRNREIPESISWIDQIIINGFLSHLLDFDDMGNSIRGHPSGPVLSALIPLAHLIGATGEDFLSAYMVAVDGMAIAGGRGVATAIQAAGLHPTAIFGTIGSVLACGRLLRLEAYQLRSAIALAIVQTGGTTANFGTPAKPAQVGLGAGSGARAVQLVQKGIYGELNAIDTLIKIYGEKNNYQNLVDDDPKIESDWESGRILFKRYASCWLTHQAIQAAKELRSFYLNGDVDRINVQGSYRIKGMLGYIEPKDRFEAKFSLPYCVATALINDEPLLRHLTPLHIDEKVLNLAQRVKFEIHPSLADISAIDKEFVKMELVFKSGERHGTTITGKAAISSRKELIDKARVCFEAGERRSDQLQKTDEFVTHIESAPNVDFLSSLLQGDV
jgi:2-methylcitrate dehydratase PrpD